MSPFRDFVTQQICSWTPEYRSNLLLFRLVQSSCCWRECERWMLTPLISNSPSFRNSKQGNRSRYSTRKCTTFLYFAHFTYAQLSFRSGSFDSYPRITGVRSAQNVRSIRSRLGTKDTIVLTASSLRYRFIERFSDLRHFLCLPYSSGTFSKADSSKNS